MTALVEVRNLERRFVPPRLPGLRRGAAAQGHQALSGLDLSLGEGEWLSLVGTNGAGKTTLLKTLAGLQLPTAGQVQIDGVDVAQAGERLRHLIGFALADERSFFWRLTVRQNLNFFAKLLKLDHDERGARADYLLTALDLDGIAERRFDRLSTGMKQRLAIARSLLVRPRVLLMDEPTRSLDAAQAERAWSLVREELGADGALILVTHQLDEALRHCSRIALLHDGAIPVDVSVDEARRLMSNRSGIVLSVRGLTPQHLELIRGIAGVRSVRVVSELAGEATVEVGAVGESTPTAEVITRLTASGASVVGLQDGPPIGGLLEQLIERAVGQPEVVPA